MKTKFIDSKLAEKLREFRQEIILLKKHNRKTRRLFKKYGWDKLSKIKILEQIALAS